MVNESRSEKLKSRGQRVYSQRGFGQALATFRAAYAAEPRPVYLSNALAAL